MKIGVLGVGVVGSAVLRAFAGQFECYGYDLKGQYHRSELYDKIFSCDVVFVCVPSPTRRFVQDLGPLRAALSGLSARCFDGVVCIKCTVLPGTTEQLQLEYPSLKLCHNPEFLTAARPFEDFILQNRILLGGPEEYCRVVERAYAACLPAKCVIYPAARYTETAKYLRNNYLAVKVSLANEFAELCRHLDISWQSVRDAMLSQGGIEAGHWNVPGPDGKPGFSGMCLPKDLRAMIGYMRRNSMLCYTLEGAEETNESLRPHDENCKEHL